MNRFKLTLIIFDLILMVIGFFLLYLVDWKVAVGVWLLLWSNDIEQVVRKYD